MNAPQQVQKMRILLSVILLWASPGSWCRHNGQARSSRIRGTGSVGVNFAMWDMSDKRTPRLRSASFLGCARASATGRVVAGHSRGAMSKRHQGGNFLSGARHPVSRQRPSLVPGAPHGLDGSLGARRPADARPAQDGGQPVGPAAIFRVSGIEDGLRIARLRPGVEQHLPVTRIRWICGALGPPGSARIWGTCLPAMGSKVGRLITSLPGIKIRYRIPISLSDTFSLTRPQRVVVESVGAVSPAGSEGSSRTAGQPRPSQRGPWTSPTARSEAFRPDQRARTEPTLALPAWALARVSSVGLGDRGVAPPTR